METKSFRFLLLEHWQIIGVLAGVFIVYASMGTYTNWDAQSEFEAVSSVVTRGFPLLSSGLMINQPPLGYYLAAPVLLVAGLSYVNAVWFVTALGLGCIFLIYVLGIVTYGKRSGLVAAALFGLVPWQVFLARTYLIETPYMLLGLLFLIVGIIAVRRNSEKLLVAAGVLFGLAFLTKLFSAFLLLPLLLFVLLKGKESNFNLKPRKILIFLAPALVLQAIWFGGFANQNFFGVYVASDFTHPVLIADPSLTYLPRIFVESGGWFLPAAAIFSMVLAISFRKLLAQTLWVDVACTLTILVVVSADLFLVLGSHLLVPYVSAFKYNYAALPFVCLLAASLANKGRALIKSENARKVKTVLVGVGLLLIIAAIAESIAFINHSEPYPLVDFKVDYAGHYFPFFVNTPVASNFQAWHYLAGALILLVFSITYVVSKAKKWNKIS